MPSVRIQYRNHPEAGHLGVEKLRLVQQVILTNAPMLFSLKRLPLTKDDFSVVFEAESMGLLTHDVIVRIELHHFRARRKKNDKNALLLAHLIARAIDDINKAPITVGVSLLLAEIGWGATNTYAAHNFDVSRMRLSAAYGTEEEQEE
jgi:hypothetical protein